MTQDTTAKLANESCKRMAAPTGSWRAKAIADTFRPTIEQLEQQVAELTEQVGELRLACGLKDGETVTAAVAGCVAVERHDTEQLEQQVAAAKRLSEAVDSHKKAIFEYLQEALAAYPTKAESLRAKVEAAEGEVDEANDAFKATREGT